MDIVEEMRGFEADHEPDGWPAVRMRKISALCNEVERLRETLVGILNANPRKWEELSEPMSEFERWAKSRANHALVPSNAELRGRPLADGPA